MTDTAILSRLDALEGLVRQLLGHLEAPKPRLVDELAALGIEPKPALAAAARKRAEEAAQRQLDTARHQRAAEEAHAEVARKKAASDEAAKAASAPGQAKLLALAVNLQHRVESERAHTLANSRTDTAHADAIAKKQAAKAEKVRRKAAEQAARARSASPYSSGGTLGR